MTIWKNRVAVMMKFPEAMVIFIISTHYMNTLMTEFPKVPSYPSIYKSIFNL